jgi:hypothetical protein
MVVIGAGRHAPVLDLILILAGLPVIAPADGWLFAGREPRAIGRART